MKKNVFLLLSFGVCSLSLAKTPISVRYFNSQSEATLPADNRGMISEDFSNAVVIQLERPPGDTSDGGLYIETGFPRSGIRALEALAASGVALEIEVDRAHLIQLRANYPGAGSVHANSVFLVTEVGRRKLSSLFLHAWWRRTWHNWSPLKWFKDANCSDDIASEE
jgi:hypothetical protein